MGNNFLYRLFITDYKTFDIETIDNLANCKMKDKINPDITIRNDSIENMLKRYFSYIGDYENHILTEALFFRLGWSNKYKDTILSFRNILYSTIEYFSNPQNGGEEITYKRQTVQFYNKNRLSYTIDGNEHCYKKSILWEKYVDSQQIFHKAMNKVYECNDIIDSLKQVAELSDSMANFMPCPGYPFNQLKGLLEDVGDSLNLMADKIQKSIDDNDELNCNGCIAKLEKLKQWKNWLIENRETYCLDGFFSVDEGKIKGKKLFDNQSLTHPNPTNLEELKNYLSETICRLNKRAEDMSKSVH